MIKYNFKVELQNIRVNYFILWMKNFRFREVKLFGYGYIVREILEIYRILV